MTDRTATHDGNRPKIEQAGAVADHAGVQQMRHWVTARKLDGCRGCTGFRIEESGLADIIASPHSDRPRRQARGDGSRPTFASA